jgi:hypothetical protein
MLVGLLPLVPTRAGGLADDLIPASSHGDNALGLVRGRGGETADTITGRLAHAKYPEALGTAYDYGVRLPSGRRPNAVDWEHLVVRELKPDNPRAVQRGWTQVRNYLSELFEMSGETWSAFVDTYWK